MTEKEFYQYVGRRLRELREKAGIKQKELAQKLGISPSVLSEAEKGGEKLSAYRINQILGALGYSQSDLFDDEKKKNLRLSFAVS
jgi:transcriptional regulator with XRE-family HTH domain